VIDLCAAELALTWCLQMTIPSTRVLVVDIILSAVDMQTPQVVEICSKHISSNNVDGYRVSTMWEDHSPPLSLPHQPRVMSRVCMGKYAHNQWTRLVDRTPLSSHDVDVVRAHWVEQWKFFTSDDL
jgi:uncharacterized protein (DUF1786 family)